MSSEKTAEAVAHSEPREYFDVVFDGPPSHESGRFVEVENEHRQSVRMGEWVERDDGYRALRLPATIATQAEEIERLRGGIEMLKGIGQATIDKVHAEHEQETIDLLNEQNGVQP